MAIHLAGGEILAVTGGDTWWCVLAASVGVLAGFQSMYERYEEESFRLLGRLLGVFYLLTRGGVPAILFVVLPKDTLGEMHPAVLALILGASTEVVLRTKFFIRQTKDASGQMQDLSKGPFDLLQWYQDLFLDRMGGIVARWSRDSAWAVIPDGISFDDLMAQIQNRLINIRDEQQRDRVLALTAATNVEYTADPRDAVAKEAHYIERLVFRLRDGVGQRLLEVLIA